MSSAFSSPSVPHSRSHFGVYSSKFAKCWVRLTVEAYPRLPWVLFFQEWLGRLSRNTECRSGLRGWDCGRGSRWVYGDGRWGSRLISWGVPSWRSSISTRSKWFLSACISHICWWRWGVGGVVVWVVRWGRPEWPWGLSIRFPSIILINRSIILPLT